MSTDFKMTGKWRVGVGEPVLERRMPAQDHRTKAWGLPFAFQLPYLLLLFFPLSLPLSLPLLLSLCENRAMGQAMPIAPDCQLFLSFSTAGTTATFDNRAQGCVSWTLQYTSSGFSGLTLLFQSAQGAVTPGTFGAYGGTTVTGANPMSSTTGEVSTFVNGIVNIPWVNVKVSGLGGSGNITGVLYGYKSGSGGGGGGGAGGCPSATPCVVIGPTASGSPQANAPVQVAGNDGTDVRNLATDASGDTKVVGPVAVGSAVGNPVTTGGQSSAGNAVNDFFCDNSAAVSISGSGLTQIVALTSGKQIRVCHLDFSAGAASNFTIEYGTGSACGTGTTAISGTYQTVVAFAADYGEKSPLTAPAGNAMCLNFGSSVTAGGVVLYAIY
jgi:hypothetical protein